MGLSFGTYKKCNPQKSVKNRTNAIQLHSIPIPEYSAKNIPMANGKNSHRKGICLGVIVVSLTSDKH